MKNYLNIFILIVSYFFILLFVYAGISKILDFENFQVQIGQSPLLSSYAGIVSYSVIISELFIAFLLIFSQYRIIGLYGSLGIMTSFTIYIYLILNYSEFIPCSCGGILEKLGWEEHLIFNVCCVVAAAVSIFILEHVRKHWIKTLVSVTIMIILNCALVMILFFSSEQMIKKGNSFVRRFPHHLIIKEKSLDLKVNSYYFAGVSEGKIILGNYTNPMIITEVDPSMNNYRKQMIKLDNYDHGFKFLKLYVQGSEFYLADGTVPIIYRGTIKSHYAETVSYKKFYFDQIAVIDSVKIAFRTFNPKTMVRSLGILNTASGKYELNPNIIQKQKDGIFDTDGYLIADNQTDQYYYNYFYRNVITSADADQLFSSQHTIDTTSIAKVQSKMMTNGKIKMNAPPVMVNKMGTAVNGFLFNQSNLMGKYENRNQWKTNSIIDIYNTNNKSYRGSFYIQNKGDDKLIQMFATYEYFYTLIGNEIIRYRYAQAFSSDLRKGNAENLTLE